MKTCNINNHHIPDLLPRHKDDESPETVGGICSQVGVVGVKDAVKNHLPDIAQNDAADQVRHKKDGTEDVRASELLRQRIGKRKSKHIDDDNVDNRNGRRVLKGVPEAVVGKDFTVVFKSVPDRIQRGVEVTEGKIDPPQEGEKEADAKG